MKRILLYATIFTFSFANAQCYVQITATNETCCGVCDGSATAYPGGGTPGYSYSWLPGGQTTQSISGQCAGTYTCTITDSLGCFATATCTINCLGPLQPGFSNVMNPTCQSCCDGGFTATATGGTIPYSYTLWLPSGPPPLNPFSSISNACSGTYTLCVVDGVGCYTCDTLNLSFQSAVTNNSVNENLSITNSGNGIFRLEAVFASSQSGEISIINLMGESIVVQKFESSVSLSSSIDLSNQPAGMYFVSVVTASGGKTVRVMR